MAFKYADGSMLFAFAVSTKLYKLALAFAPSVLAANNQFFSVSVKQTHLLTTYKFITLPPTSIGYRDDKKNSSAEVGVI